MYQRGDLYWGNLDPQKGSEQAGTRPVLIFQDESLWPAANTAVIIPFTSQLQWRRLPTCVFVPGGTGGLRQDSVALCHQIRMLDKSGIGNHIGTLPPEVLREIEDVVLLTLGLAD